jgi:hypothetical protein
VIASSAERLTASLARPCGTGALTSDLERWCAVLRYDCPCCGLVEFLLADDGQLTALCRDDAGAWWCEDDGGPQDADPLTCCTHVHSAMIEAKLARRRRRAPQAWAL